MLDSLDCPSLVWTGMCAHLPFTINEEEILKSIAGLVGRNHLDREVPFSMHAAAAAQVEVGPFVG